MAYKTGRKGGETYPESPKASSSGGGGAILQIASSDTLIPTSPNSEEFVNKTPGVPLEIVFTEWNPGDVLVVDIYSRCSVAEIGPEIEYNITPVINVGDGWQIVSPTSGDALVASPSALSGISIVSTTAVRLDVAPAVRLTISNPGGDAPNLVGPISLKVTRYDGTKWFSGPDGTLQ